MRARLSIRVALVTIMLGLLPSSRTEAQWGAQPPPPAPGWTSGAPRHAFDRGFHEGYDEGVQAGRRGHPYDPYRERDYRRADRGYERHLGSREAYRWNFRRGFEAGYARGFTEGRRRAYRYGPWGGPRWP
jgi:hypothetical protein